MQAKAICLRNTDNTMEKIEPTKRQQQSNKYPSHNKKEKHVCVKGAFLNSLHQLNASQ